jgi:2,3-bisphosphoglycerate-dependent phosphoglycerate mutase
MIQLILMRHGNTFEAGQIPLQVGARTDLPLTSQGRLQVERMICYLRSKNTFPQVIYAGDLKRQTESAQLIGSAFGLPFEKSSALTEIDYGLWEGLSAAEIEARWPTEYKEWTEMAKWPSQIFQGTAETHLQKLESWFDEMRKKDKGKTVVAVTSNGLLRFFRNEKVKTGHFCEIQVQEKGFQILSWNQNPNG